MRKIVVSVMASSTLSLFLCSGTIAGSLTSGVSFSQVDFTYPGASQSNSQYGQVFLDYSQIPGNGYVNVVTSTGWVVQNMPVFGGSALPGLSMMFDLGFSGPQATPFLAVVDYSPAPLIDTSTISGPTQNFGFLSHVEHNAEGGPDPLTAAPGSPAGKMTTTFDPLGVTSLPVINTTSRSVEQDVNQCGPAAVANSLAYLNARYGVKLAHTHKPGINGVPADSLVGQIDVKVPRAQGQGVWRSDLLDGKLKYLDMFGPHGLIIKHQGTFDANGAVVINNNRTQGQETSTFKGNLVTLQFLMNEIHHGEDIEMDLTFNGAFGAGHEIMITGGDTILGRPYVTFIHDAVQGNNAKGTGLFDGGYGFAWLEDPGGGARIKFKGYVIGSNNLNAEIRNVITESFESGIPTLSSWAMVSLVGLLLVTGGILIAKRAL